MSDEPYGPFDQETRLPPPPWSHDDPALKAWEAAHGHDVRLKCYPEFGCLLIEQALERKIASLESQNQTLQEERDTYRDMWLTDHKAFEDERTISLALQERAERAEARKDVWHERFEAVAEEVRALQERAEKAEAYLLVIADGDWNEAHVRKVEGRDVNIPVEQFARNALYPTQETDPDRCPTCHASFREYSAYIAAGRTNHYCLDPWHKTPWPTQETDPE